MPGTCTAVKMDKCILSADLDLNSQSTSSPVSLGTLFLCVKSNTQTSKHIHTFQMQLLVQNSQTFREHIAYNHIVFFWIAKRNIESLFPPQ